jgi:hypothetical protein
MVYELFYNTFNLYSSFFKLYFNLEVFILQILLLIFLFYCFNSDNIFYTLLYTFLLFFFIGVFLCFFQLVVFTAFLWLIELTIIFVFILIIFYLNFKGYYNKLNSKLSFLKKISFFLFYFLICLLYNYDSENTISYNLIPIYIYDDFYESFKNTNMNDLQLLLISYYYFNSLEYLIISLILFLGSILCINIFKINKIEPINNVYNFISNFDFFKKNISFYLLRKQNVFFQNLSKPSTRVTKKKY